MASSAKSTSKRQKPSEPEEATVVDRISNLPDSLLSHILSFLTIKESVTTSILSSRWKPLWTLVPNLVLAENEFERIPLSSDEDEEQSPNNRYRFAHIVARVCAIRNANPLKKFRLHWYIECDPIHADTWVRAAIARDLEELDLHLCPHHLFNFSYYVKTLVVLKLSGNIVINPPSSTSLGFPRLKNLHLEWVKYANHDSFSILLNCCPVLQDLCIKIRCDWKKNFKINVATLKRLDLHACYPLYKLVINAPALEYLSFRGFLVEDVLLENLSNLVEAVLNVKSDDTVEDYENRVWDFISALYSVKSLHLHAETTKCLSKDSKFDLPMFHNLALLNFCFESSMWHVLPLFLERAPNLEVLILDKNLDLDCPPEECDTSIECIFYEDVPKCVSSHLTAFHFKGFQGFNAELDLVGQILKWARVLKKMTISSEYLDSEEEVRVLKELLMLPRQSATCKIEFN